LDLDDYFRGADPRPARPGITASVGRWEKGAVNRRADVETVQLLLTAAAKRQRAPALDPRGADGLIAPAPRSSRTVAAIESFEASRKLPVDGVIEPGSPSWQALLEAAGQRPPRESRLSPLHAAVRER
ncbi:MAG: hypothetical protein GWO24_35060, partial [Akkermansiaceae bacterium]|nr:hypothetical protein [Akkermansiaceae bacterium]